MIQCFHELEHQILSTMSWTYMDVPKGILELCPLGVHGLVPLVHLFPQFRDDALPLFQQPRQFHLQKYTTIRETYKRERTNAELKKKSVEGE